MDRPIRAILDEKERHGWVASTTPDATVAAAVQQMNSHRIGSLLVMHYDTVAGIFTERDVLVRVVSAGRDPATTRVRDVMSTNVVSVAGSTTVREAMSLMTNNRWRHLPVIEDGKVIGMVSIGDITWWLVNYQQSHIEDLERYITSG